jgi:ABC-type multidrug transport system fused ATPase/permease subunit
MSQSFIDALMHFLSLLFLPLPGKKIYNLRQKLEDYFDKAAFIYPPEECIKIYNTYSSKYFFEFSNHSYQSSSDFYNIQKHLLHEAALKAQGNLYLQERLLIILALIEFSEVFYKEDEDLKLHIQELSRSLNLEQDDYTEAYNFITGKENKDTGVELNFRELPEVNEDLEGVWVEEHLHETTQGMSHNLADRIQGQIAFHYFKRYNYLVFKFESKFLAFLNEVKIYPGFFYTFRRKDILQFEGLEPILYNEIEAAFQISTTPVINLAGEDISYRFKKSNYSIKTFSFSENSGQLIGIIGNNGAGKSTILKLISNQLDSHTGKLYINGSNLIENRLPSVLHLICISSSGLHASE